jgi:hypothetical protein
MTERSDPPRRRFQSVRYSNTIPNVTYTTNFPKLSNFSWLFTLINLYYLQLHITEIRFPLGFIRSISHAPNQKQLDGADAQRWIADDPKRILTSGIGITWYNFCTVIHGTCSVRTSYLIICAYIYFCVKIEVECSTRTALMRQITSCYKATGRVWMWSVIWMLFWVEYVW